MTAQRLSRAAEALAALSELDRYRLASEAAGLALFDWTVADDSIHWSNQAIHVLPVRDLHDVQTGQGLRALLDQEGAAFFAQLLRAPPAEPESFTREFRLRAADGSFAWVETSGVAFAAGGRLERIVGMLRLVTGRKLEELRLGHLAAFDDLTGQLNRTSLRETLAAHLARARTGERPCAFVVAAIDGLAVLNEAYGFETADEVILAVSRRLASGLGSDDSLGRISGNKFGLVLAGCDAAQIEAMCEQLKSAVGDTVIATSVGAVSASVSIGAVLLPDGADTGQEAMLRAEEALDRAKRHGRDSFALYTPSPETSINRRRNISLGDQVLTALNEKRLRLAYQAIVDAQTGEPASYECLLRMLRPDGSVASAGEFIPVAEQLGLVRLIDRRVLEMAAEVLLAQPGLRLSVNVSGVSVGDARWMKLFTDIADVEPEVIRRLTVEVTETAALTDIEDSVRFVAALRGHGAKVAIDDFGAGYTSFRNLQMLDVDSVKIDGTFVKGLADSRDNQVFVRTLVELARHFEIETTAEWVGSREEAAILRSFGVGYLQGFLYGQPTLTPDWQQS